MYQLPVRKLYTGTFDSLSNCLCIREQSSSKSEVRKERRQWSYGKRQTRHQGLLWNPDGQNIVALTNTGNHKCWAGARWLISGWHLIQGSEEGEWKWGYCSPVSNQEGLKKALSFYIPLFQNNRSVPIRNMLTFEQDAYKTHTVHVWMILLNFLYICNIATLTCKG